MEISLAFTATPLQTDFYLLSDATGSMSTAIHTAKTQFADLVKIFADRTSVAFGAGIFRDEVELDDGFQNLQAISTDLEATRKAIASMTAIGGIDAPEANLVALYKIATENKIGWRPRSRKILVYFGDNPGHEASCFDGITMNREKVIGALKAKGITVIGISYKSSYQPGLDGATFNYRCGGSRVNTPAGQATAITKGTNGVLITSSNQALLVSNINSAVKALPKTFQVDTSDCDSQINTAFSPTLPITLAPSASSVVVQKMTLKDGVCSLGGNFKCKFRYLESGADLPSTEVNFLNVSGCTLFAV